MLCHDIAMERSLENFDKTKRPLEYSYSLHVLEFQVRPDTFGLLKVSVAVSYNLLKGCSEIRQSFFKFTALLKNTMKLFL